MKLQIITLFPDMFTGVLNTSMLLKAQDKKLAEFKLINLRDFGIGPRKTVDDTPYGGGDGMVLKPEPIFAAVEAAKEYDPSAEVILMTPRGRLYKQKVAMELSKNGRGKIIICGRYEGYDERITTIVDWQLRIGDYVLTGGEVPAMAVVDSIVRLLPGVLGGATSAQKESFSEEQIIEHPQYTRPEVYSDLKVPKVLLSGNHAEIMAWQKTNQRKVDDKQ